MNITFDFSSALIYPEDPPKVKKACWLSGSDFGRNRIVFTQECTGDGCKECNRYIDFYRRVHQLERQGISFGEAVRRTETEGVAKKNEGILHGGL